MPTPRPRYQRLNHDQRREQILTVARRMFTELPYAEVSTTAIAGAAGVQRGLLHYYFGTKRELFLEVVRDLTRQVAAHADPPADAPADEAGSLREVVDVHVGRFLDAAEANATTWFAAIDAEGFGHDPQLLRIIAKSRDNTVEYVLKVLRISAPTDTLRAVLRTYAGLADVATREWLQQRNLDRAQTHTLLATTLLTLVQDVAPAIDPSARSRGS